MFLTQIYSFVNYASGNATMSGTLFTVCQNDSPCQKTAKKPFFAQIQPKLGYCYPNVGHLLPKRWVKLSIFWAFTPQHRGPITQHWGMDAQRWSADAQRRGTDTQRWGSTTQRWGSTTQRLGSTTQRWGLTTQR